MRTQLRFLATLAFTLALSLSTACGPQSGEPTLPIGQVMQGIWSPTPSIDPLSGLPYTIKVADAAGNGFGSDPVTYGPIPPLYPMPSPISGCFWQASNFRADGTIASGCACVVAQVATDWAGTYTVAAPPGGTTILNLKISWSGSPLYAPCYGRKDQGYIIDKLGKVVFAG